MNLATNLHDESMFTKQLHGRTADHLRQVQKPVAINLYTRPSRPEAMEPPKLLQDKQVVVQDFFLRI